MTCIASSEETIFSEYFSGGFRFVVISLHHRRSLHKDLAVLTDFHLDIRHHLPNCANPEALCREAAHCSGSLGKAIAIDQVHIDRLHETIDVIREGCSRHREEITAVNTHHTFDQVKNGMLIKEKLQSVG